MVAGIEAAGLALAIFPVVVEMVDWYSGNVTGRDSKLLAESLKNNEQMFLNSLESLLRSVVPAAELQVLLSDLTGDAWRDQTLNHRVAEHLGCEVDSIMESIDDIYRTVSKLKEKLPAQSAATNAVVFVRAKTIVKRFLHGPHNKASLERLKIRITEFRKLTKDALKLASSRNVVPKALRNLDLVQECASGLHDALQSGWQCNCEKLHPANIELDVWSLRADEQSDKVHLKFSFLFADDAQRAQSDHWMTAEITPSQPSPRGARAPMLGSANGISLSPISLTSRDSAWTRPQTVSPSAISDTSQDDDTDADSMIGDLCAVIKSPEGSPPRPVRHRHGSISDRNGHSYHLFSKFDPLTTTPTRSSVKLADFFNQSYALSNRNRVRLALMLAWGVLQISSTSWLRGNWTKDNILLVMDAPNRPLPYISHRFHSARRNSKSSTLTPTASNEMAAWIRNTSLFALGIFLLEVCYNRSIEDLATNEEKGGNGEPSPYAQILTAMRLSKVVQDELGLYYAQAVEACLRLPGVDMDSEGEPRDSAQFARSMVKNIIEPLEAVAKSFGE